MIDKTISHYRIIKKLSGRVGVVYKTLNSDAQSDSYSKTVKPMSPDLPNSITSNLDSHAVGQKLGGGMGIVCKAEETSLGRFVDAACAS